MPQLLATTNGVVTCDAHTPADDRPRRRVDIGRCLPCEVDAGRMTPPIVSGLEAEELADVMRRLPQIDPARPFAKVETSTGREWYVWPGYAATAAVGPVIEFADLDLEGQ
jgi:hypothetical protein